MMPEHEPRYKYDCERCKFNWNCGILCACVLSKRAFPDPPPERAKEVKEAQERWRRRRRIADSVEEMAAFFSELANDKDDDHGLPITLIRRGEDMIHTLDHLAEDIRAFRAPEEKRYD
jgi:hypothetical protein